MDTAGSKPATTSVKAKCPSLGEAWVHWAPASMTQTLFAGFNETTKAFAAHEKEEAAHAGHSHTPYLEA
jgi:hypothetical protein